MSNATPHSPSASASQANPAARGFSRFVATSVRPVVFKLSRKLSVTYWPGRRRSISAMLLALLSSFVPGLAGAGPTGSRVVAGSATVLKPTTTTTQVNQTSQNVIINWQSFSIGAGEAVRFVQPSASAVALNRVIGSDPSRIFGTLQANGKVFLVNNAGVYFAPGAKVDVGGLVATSMNISNASFLSGKYTFDATAQAGEVANFGQLRGAFVVLAAPQVTNAGSIVTTGGATALAAGGRVSLDIAGDKLVTMSVDAAVANAAVVNSGSVSADGGKVFMSANSANAVLDTVINTSGIVRAASIANRNGQIVIDGGSAGVVQVSGTLAASGAGAGLSGGAVQVLGDKVALLNGASIDVSGDTGGGSALVGGDLHGAGSVRTAAFTQVDGGAVINADALMSGNGGKVVVWSDQHTGFGGGITAKGGAQGGDGGFVETSGKATLAFAGRVNTTAAHGATGSLLLDPTDITIDNSPTSGGGGFGGGTFGATAATSTLNVDDLTTVLGSSNVIVDTASAAAGTGNITVGNDIAWASANSLTLKALGGITNNAQIHSNGGGAINLNADGVINSGTLTSTSGAISIAGNAGGASRAASVTGGTIASTSGAVSIRSAGAVTTGAINAGSGTISVNGNAGVAITGALSTTNSSGSAIVVNAGANSSAGIGAGGDITVAGGSVSVGAGGSATLYTGSIAGSTGITAAVGAGSGNFRYDSAAGTDNFSAPLSAGVSAVYREQPTLTVGVNGASITYGDAVPALTLTYNTKNGDTSLQAFSTGPSLSVGSTNSTSGHAIAGTHAATVSGAVDQLGYALAYTNGILTVAKKSLNSSGSTAAGKTYDGTTPTSVITTGTTVASGGANSGDGLAYAGDAVSVDNAAATSGSFADKNAGVGKAVVINGLALQGLDAGNYTVTGSTTATIAQKVLTATATAADKVYDGNTSATAAITLSGLVGAESVGGSGTSAFNSKDVATANLVTVSAIALADGANGGLAGNYSVAAGQTGTAHITRMALTGSVTAPDKVYDGNTTAAATLAITGGLIAGESLGVSGMATFNSKNVATANLVTVQATVLSNGAGGGVASNYGLTPGMSVTAHITPKALTATASVADKAYDGNLGATAVMSIDGAGFVGTETVTATGAGTFNTKNVQTANLVTVNSVLLADGLNGGLGSNYSVAAGQTGSAHITPKALSFSVTAPDKVYDANDVAAPVLAITGLANTEQLVVSATGTFNTKNVLTANLVTAQLTGFADGANGGMASNYTLAGVQTATAHITPKPLTATATATDKVYDGTTNAATALSIASGLVGGETVNVTGSGVFNSKDVLPANLVTVNSLALADGANGGLASNYSLAAGQTAAAHITPHAVTVTVAAADKAYDGNKTASAVINIAGLVGTEIVTGTGSGTFDSKDVLTATEVTVNSITLADGANGGLASNYSVGAGQVATAHITRKALTATATAADKVYDGDSPAVTALTIDVPGLVGTETLIVTATGAFNTKDVLTANEVTVGAVTLADGANGGLASNYSLGANQTAVAHITPKGLSATIASVDKVYDGNKDASATMNLAGLIGSEIVTATGAGLFDYKDVLTAAQVVLSTVTLADGANGGLASNYSAAGGQIKAAHITPKTLAATATATDKIYDGLDSATPTLTITSGLVPSETVTATGSAVFDSKNVVGVTPVTVTTVALADGANGGLASNYHLDPGQTTTAKITPKALTATASAANKVYDGGFSGNAVMNIDAAGLVGTETVTGTGTGLFDGKDVLTAANKVTVNTVTLADGAHGGLATNYSLGTGQTGLAQVTAKALTATVAPLNKVYDGGSVAAPVLTITAGLVGSETLGVSGTGTFNNQNVVGASLVTVNTVALANGGNGGIASNYSLAAGQHAAASVSQKPLTASASANGKVYDGNTIASTVLTVTSGLVGFETVSATGSGAFDSKDVLVASRVTVQATALSNGANGGLASNYSLGAGQVANNVRISARPLTATAVSGDKVYDGNLSGTAVMSVNAAGLVGAETVSASGTGLFNSKDVGSATNLLVNAVQLADGANGGLASNYSLGAGQSVAANITQRPSVSFIGAAGGNWSDAANWEAGAIPDLANVANVIIPAGKSVIFNASVPALSGAVKVDGIDGAGALVIDSGTLTVVNALKIGGYAQSAGEVGAGALSATSDFNQTGGKLTVKGKVDIVQSTGIALLGDITAADLSIGGGGAAQTASGTVLVKGTVTLDTGAGDVVLSNKKNDFGTVTIVSAHDVTLNDINRLEVNGKVSGTLKTTSDTLTVGQTTVAGNFIASALGAINQIGALDVTGSTIIDSIGLLSLDDKKNALRGRVRVNGGADVVLASSGGLAIGGDVGGKLVLTASGPVIQTAGDALHVKGSSSIDAGAGAITLTEKDNHFGGGLSVKGGAVSVIDKGALALGESSVAGSLSIVSGGAVTQTGALTAGGATSINASGQAITLTNAGNDFGGELSLTGAATQVTDKNALTLGNGDVKDSLQLTAKGDITQKGVLTVSGTTAIDTTGAIVLGSDGNDFVGTVSATASSILLKDKNVLTVTKLTASKVDLGAGSGLQVAPGGIVDSPNIALSLSPTAVKGAIGTLANKFEVRKGARVVLGTSTPAVPTYIGGDGAEVVVSNLASSITYSNEGWSMDARTRVNSSFASIMQATQKKADSNAELIERGLPTDLTVPIPYPHEGAMRTRAPDCSGREGCN